MFKYQNYNLGYYDDIHEVVQVRKEAEQEIFGKFLVWYENHKKYNV